MAKTGAATPNTSRIIGIDILRGYAMINVVLYHLWDDIRFLPYPPNWFYEQLGGRIRNGEWSSIPTSLLDIVMRGGFIIATFMMLTGLSLYMATARKGGGIDRLVFWRRRLRQLLVPYWFAIAMVMVVICGIALLQMALHGHGFAYQYHHVTQARWTYVAPGRWELLASIAVLPRAVRSEWLMVPPSVMWFVVLFVQYYLLFPFLAPLLKRFGPARFLLGALAITATAKVALIFFAGGLDHDPAKYLNHSMAIFRGFEFALGMALGYVLVHHRERLTQLVSPPRTIAVLVTTGLALIIAGTMMDDRATYHSAIAAPIIISGVALIALPLITKPAGRLEASAPARLFAWAGLYSYSILIANEPLRLIASFLRVEEIPTGLWWLYLAAYMPATLMLAKPLAPFLGLAPGRRTYSHQEAPAAAQREALATSSA